MSQLEKEKYPVAKDYVERNEKYFTDAHKKIYFINQYFDDVIYLSSINIE